MPEERAKKREVIWHLTLLGNLKAQQGERVIEHFATRKAANLLAYLAFYSQHRHTREALADLLWPDQPHETARNNLRQTLYSLRASLEPDTAPEKRLLLADNNALWLDTAQLTTDVRMLEACLHEAAQTTEREPKIACLSEAVTLYQGELLNGFYEDWVIAERYRLERLYTQALGELADLLEAAGNLLEAIGVALRLVALNPLDEESHLRVMQLHAEAGHPDRARQQYQEMTQVLRRELNTSPSRLAADRMAWIEKELVSSRQEARPFRVAPPPEVPANAPPASLPQSTVAPVASTAETHSAQEVSVAPPVARRARGRWGLLGVTGAFLCLLFWAGARVWRATPFVEPPLPAAYPAQQQELLALRRSRRLTPAQERRRARLCAALAEQLRDSGLTKDEALWIERANEASQDMEASLGWSVEHEPDLAVQISGALGRYWQKGHRGQGDRLKEGRRWMELALQHSTPKKTKERARLLVILASTMSQVNEHRNPQTEAYCREGLALYRELGDRNGEASAIRTLGTIAGWKEEADAAVAYYQQALEIYRETKNKRGEAMCLLSMGMVGGTSLPPHEETHRQLTAKIQGLKAFRELGNQWGVDLLLSTLEDVVNHLPDAEARPYQKQMIPLYAELTTMQCEQFHFEEARKLRAKRFQLARKLQQHRAATEDLYWFAQIYWDRYRRDIKQAALIYGACAGNEERFPAADVSLKGLKDLSQSHEAEFARGRTVTLDQALTEAMKP